MHVTYTVLCNSNGKNRGQNCAIAICFTHHCKRTCNVCRAGKQKIGSSDKDEKRGSGDKDPLNDLRKERSAKIGIYNDMKNTKLLRR